MVTKEERVQDTTKRLEKLQKKIPPDMLQELKDMDETQLRDRIVLCQANLAENERERDADAAYAEAKEAYQEAGAPYKEAKATQMAIAHFCTLLLELKDG